MPPDSSDIVEAKGQVEEAAHRAARGPWVERLARFGYATKGLVYVLIGALAVLAGVGARVGRVTGPSGALRAIAERPFGRVLLWVVAAGLAGYVLWRFVQAALDPEHDETSARRVGMRLIYAGSGLIYAGVALTAVQIALGAGDGGDGGEGLRRIWAAWLLAQPFGQLLLGLAGLIVVVVGLVQFYKAYRAKFREKHKIDEMSRAEVLWTARVGRFGLVARGVVFCVAGGFVVQAALHSDPNEVRGIEGSLRALAGQGFGSWLLAGVAAGLIAYGLFMLVEARYRRIARR